jgi:hypothetical protein
MDRKIFIAHASSALVYFGCIWKWEGVETGPLPRALIIGDSISIGYTPFVQDLLRGRVEVVHNPGNAQHTGTGLEKLDAWLGSKPWNIIHFNWGLWDLCYRHPESTTYGNRDKIRGIQTFSVQEYQNNLEELVKRLKKTGARLVWASTTPIPPGEAGRIRGDALRYNAAAAEVMDALGIPTNDLYAYIYDHMDEFQIRYGDVHFTEEGYRYLAKAVASCILKHLENKAWNV